MAKFIKSKFKVLWGTIFSFFYGFFATDLIAQENCSRMLMILEILLRNQQNETSSSA